jgi:hypothetical protein
VHGINIRFEVVNGGDHKDCTFLGCDDAMNSEDGDNKMWQDSGENCVIRRFMIVLFTVYCSKTLI